MSTPDQDRYKLSKYPLRFVRKGDKYVLQNPYQPDINPDYYTPETWEASVLCPHCGGKVVVKTPIKP
jgi:hypothetical protein